MKESIANTYVFTLIITVIGICSVLIVSSIMYTKTFKIKNRIIEIIEKYGSYDSSNRNEVDDEITEFLRNANYNVPSQGKSKCPKRRGTENEAVNELKTYKYCIYEFKTPKGVYYSVSVFMRFEFPLIGEFIGFELPMYGDTKIIYNF